MKGAQVRNAYTETIHKDGIIEMLADDLRKYKLATFTKKLTGDRSWEVLVIDVTS
jgi:hypothetical protein